MPPIFCYNLSCDTTKFNRKVGHLLYLKLHHIYFYIINS